MRSILAWVLDAVYPRACAGCGEGMGREPGNLCWECRAQGIPAVEPFCARCGDPIDGLALDTFTCSACRKNPPDFDLARSAYRHRGPLKKALLSFKYNGNVALCRDFGDMLAACVRARYGEVAFDAVTAVPLYPVRRRSRTYNQSALLAGHVARRLGIPGGCWNGLVRLRSTQTQTGLNLSQRAANVKDAFAVKEPDWVAGRNFLLVDDVMTTGATVRECSRVLKAHGALGVYVVTVMRG